MGHWNVTYNLNLSLIIIFFVQNHWNHNESLERIIRVTTAKRWINDDRFIADHIAVKQSYGLVPHVPLFNSCAVHNNRRKRKGEATSWGPLPQKETDSTPFCRFNLNLLNLLCLTVDICRSELSLGQLLHACCSHLFFIFLASYHVSQSRTGQLCK